jgi:formylglycine-generating enzyme required for sulfatase activity
MLLVPAGSFTMGADAGGEEDERPAHLVTLPAFWLDRTHVTNADYDRCVAAGACAEKNRRAASRVRAGRDEDFQRPRQPVVGVSWNDAKTYCGWVNKRLPREAELERAMRGDDGRMFPWGDALPSPTRAVYGRPFGKPKSTTDDVGTHPEGRGPFGHDDLAGNAWQWCDDAYDPYAYRRETADRGIPGSCDEILEALNELRRRGRRHFTGSNGLPHECERVLRGGAFNYEPRGLRATNRVHHPARFRIVVAGFRCARDAVVEPSR